MDTVTNFIMWMLAHPDEALLIASAIMGMITWIGRLKVAKAADRQKMAFDALANLREAAATGAGRIMLALSQIPVGTNRDQLVRQLLRQEAAGIFQEFSTGRNTAAEADATPEKLEAMLKGMLGNAVGTVEPPVVTPFPGVFKMPSPGDVVPLQQSGGIAQANNPSGFSSGQGRAP